jgi:glycosidase
MPELNFDNEAVRQAMVDVAKYYLDLGVDGFRFDAAKYIYFGETSTNYAFWDWYMGELRAIKPDIYSVAEVWDGDGATFPYFSSTNCFNFSMAQTSGRIAETAKGGDVNPFVNYVASYLDSIHGYNPDAAMVTFIANHDTDRAAGFLPVSNGQAKVAANLSILLPGSTFVYYGEEIGMKGSRGGANTDANRRLAMNWGDGDTVRDPEGADYSAGQTNGTVAEQILAADSLYNHYKKLIAIRKANPEIAYGQFKPLNTDMDAAGFLATYEGSTVAVLHNTTTEAVTVDLSSLTDVSLTVLAAFAGVGGATLEGTILTIDAQTSVVLR